MILSDIKRLFNRNAVFSIALVVILCFSSKVLTSDPNPPSFFELLYKRVFKKGESLNYFSLLDQYDNNYWFYIVLPVILSFPAARHFYNEWFEGGYYFTISRCGMKKYIFSKSISWAIVSAALFLIGIIVFALFLLFFFPNFSDTAELFPNGAARYFMIKISNAVFVAAAYPMFSILVLILIKEKFLSLSIPMIIQYLSARIGGDLFMKSFVENNLFDQKLAMLLPYYQTKQYLYFEDLFDAPISVWYALFVIQYFCMIAVFYLLTKRRIQHNA